METMKSEAPHSDFRERAVRYLAGEMGSDERHRFEQEMAGDEEKQRIFREFASIWSGVDHLAARSRYDLDREWAQFSGKIDLETGDGPSSHKRDVDGTIIRKLPRRAFAWRVAAVIVAGLAGLAGWLVLRDNISYDELAVQQGMEMIELADGSVVTLNTGSILMYGVDEQAGERRVVLRGEAYFEIAKDADRPFIIDAGAAVVQVLGTSFNVRAYEDNAVVEVTVSTGLVSMAAKSRMDQLILLNPGNAGIYDKTAKKLELISHADPNATAWKTRDILFDETPLGEVVKVISHVYQTELRLADASLADCPITVSFHDQELGAVLSVITSTLDLQMERQEGVIVLSGEGCN
jgi:ferric-dicitrate binding protein FerR (iron transport regulator)